MSKNINAKQIGEQIRQWNGGGIRRIANSAGDIAITHGEGSYLIGSDGKRYLDFAAAMGVAAIGHAHPRWVQAIREQAGRLNASVLHTPEHAQYLTALTQVLPKNLDHTALYSGGSEAVEVAIRLVQSVTGKREIVSFTNGFHGKTLATRFAGNSFPQEREWLGIDWMHHVPYPDCTAHNAVSYPNCTDSGVASLEALAKLADQRKDQVAAVIIEPIQGTAGNKPMERKFLPELQKLCHKYGWLLISDESISGFGRLGTYFANQLFEFTPDLIILGKTMGGGFPLTGVATSKELWDQSLFATLSASSSSYGANPLACAAGIAVLDIITEPDFLTKLNRVAERLARGLAEIESQSSYVTRTRGVGMMLGFDLTDPDDSGDLASPQLCLQLFRKCLDQGILIVGDVPNVRLNPPITLADSDADRALEALSAALCQ